MYDSHTIYSLVILGVWCVLLISVVGAPATVACITKSCHSGIYYNVCVHVKLILTYKCIYIYVYVYTLFILVVIGVIILGVIGYLNIRCNPIRLSKHYV